MSNNPPRLSVENAVGRYKESTGLGKLPTGMVKDFTFEKYGEEVRYLLPGMIGAMLKLDLKSISAPEIGSALPIMVLRYPVLRIILDPELTEYDTYVFVHASNYSGDPVLIDTRTEYVDKFDNDAMAYSMLHHWALWDAIDLGIAT
jgi:hypothetical protein